VTGVEEPAVVLVVLDAGGLEVERVVSSPANLGSKLRTIPVAAPWATARIAWTARPWATQQWCAAASEASGSIRPGAWIPVRYPRYEVHHGSLSVAIAAVRSPIRRATTAA